MFYVIVITLNFWYVLDHFYGTTDDYHFMVEMYRLNCFKVYALQKVIYGMWKTWKIPN